MSDLAALHAYIEGYVQGVGFRMFVQDQATSLRLTGWVRNLGDGRVEVWAEGPQDDLVTLLDHLRIGPRSASITSIEQIWESVTGKYSRFSVVATSW